jgi:3D (Asp-Asp-Asp) domain-containing protein
MVRSWYNALKGSQVFIPGYGQATVADIGGGVGGANWIDLGFDDSNYVEWHSNVTVYFLAPAPAVIPGLP